MAAYLDSNRDRLRLLIGLRLDRRLQGIIDPSDVIQETFLVASKRLEEYVANPRLPPFLWLRFLTGQRLHELHEHHFKMKKRDERRKRSLEAGLMPEVSTVALAARLMDRRASPSELAMKEEQRARVQEAIDSMEPMDREIIALRFYESLTSTETARELGIEVAAARKRYLRAMERLKKVLKTGRGP